MCNFFSFVVDKKGKPHYFEAKQQIKGRMDPHSHSTITAFYDIDDDSVWKYEADPETYAVKYDDGLPETDMKSSVEKRLDKFSTGKMIKVIEEWKQEQAILQKEIDAIVDEIKGIEWFSKKKKPLKKWKMYKARYVAMAAAVDAAKSDAWNDAWIDAWNDAALAARAATATATATAAAMAVVRAAARTAYAAARSVFRSAAWDAAAVAEARAVNLKGKHRKHLEDRMEVWRRGYGLLCDVNGILYVYETI